MKTTQLTNLLTEEQIAEAEKILGATTDSVKQAADLKAYLSQFKEQLESKGVLPDYLAYVLVAKHNKVI